MIGRPPRPVMERLMRLVTKTECRNRMCVNPDHLEPVTPKENTRRAKALIRECPSGHPYGPENTRYQPDGRRYCAECKRIRGLARYHANRRRQKEA